VRHLQNDSLGNVCRDSTPFQSSYGKENTMKIGNSGTEPNLRKRNKRVNRSYGMKKCSKKRPSVAAASLIEHWRSPTKINERTFNAPEKLKAINKKIRTSLRIPNCIEKHEIKISVSSLTSYHTKEFSPNISSKEVSDELDFTMTPQPVVKSICSIMDSDVSVKSALARKLNKKRRTLDPCRALILDSEGINVETKNNKKNPLPLSVRSRASVIKRRGGKYNHSEGKKVKKIYQPSPHSSLSDAKAFFAQLDATEELIIDTSRDKHYHLYTRSENSRCVRTMKKQNLADPSLLKSYTSYQHASKENGISPLALKMFAICRRDYLQKKKIYDGLLEDD